MLSGEYDSRNVQGFHNREKKYHVHFTFVTYKNAQCALCNVLNTKIYIQLLRFRNVTVVTRTFKPYNINPGVV
ncbi:hypothetical protein YC2023_048335 [Brassica napus]